MGRLSKFVGLPRSDQALLVETFFVLGAVRAGLCVFPFRLLRRALVDVASGSAGSRKAHRSVAERVGWAVSLAGRHLPGCRSCLVQALAAEVLLVRRGCPARLRIGVAKPEEGRLDAHAWVDSGGRTVVGGSREMSRFAPLRAVAEGGE